MILVAVSGTSAQAATGTFIQLSNAPSEYGYAGVASDTSGEQVRLFDTYSADTGWTSQQIGKVSKSGPFATAAFNQEFNGRPYFTFKAPYGSLCMGQHSGAVQLKDCSSGTKVYWVVDDYSIAAGIYSGKLINVERSDEEGTAQQMYTIGYGDNLRALLDKQGTSGVWDTWSFA